MRHTHGLALSAVLAACGTVPAEKLPDAGVDAPVRGTVQVTVLDAGGTGAPAVGANVVFLDPDGSLVKRVATDSTGKASADLLPGGSVTSIALIQSMYQLTTIMAVKPGDNLVMGSTNADFSTAGTFTINFPPLLNATSYQIGFPCGPGILSAPAAGPPTITVTIDNSCKQDEMEIVVMGTNAQGVPLGVLDKTGVPFVSGGMTTLSGSYGAPGNFTASYMNLNPNITNMLTGRSVPDGFGIGTSQQASPPTANQAINLTGATGSSALVASLFSTAAHSIQEARQFLSGTAATYGFDASAILLPWLGAPSFDAATGKLITPIDTTGTSNAQPDVFQVIASYKHTDPATNATNTLVWTVFAPTAGDITLPTLPPEVGAVAPTAQDTVTVGSTMLEADTIDGYDAIRNNLSAALLQYEGNRPPAKLVRLSLSAPAAR